VKWGLADDFDDADGVVGPNTFGRADDGLKQIGGSNGRGDVAEIHYIGSRALFDIKRDADGKYKFQIGVNGDWHTASYYAGSTTCD
jgi:hypothetical protein